MEPVKKIQIATHYKYVYKKNEENGQIVKYIYSMFLWRSIRFRTKLEEYSR